MSDYFGANYFGRNFFGGPYWKTRAPWRIVEWHSTIVSENDNVFGIDPDLTRDASSVFIAASGTGGSGTGSTGTDSGGGTGGGTSMAVTGPYVDSTLFGVKGDNASDNHDALVALMDAKHNLPILLPQGIVRTSPLGIDVDHTCLFGWGPYATIVAPMNGQNPVFLSGLRRNNNGYTVSAAHRPNSASVLDSTITSGGAWHGYSTNGDTCAVGIGNVAQTGRRDPAFGGADVYDYWQGDTYTFQCCFELPSGAPGSLATEVKLFGWGSIRNPGPLWVGLNTSGLLCVTFSTNDQGPLDPLSAWYGYSTPLALAGNVCRLRIAIRCSTNSFNVWQNSSASTLTPISNPPNLTTRKLIDPRHFIFGLGNVAEGIREGGGPRLCPVVEYHGFSVRDDYVAIEPADDHSRYEFQTGLTPHGIFALDGRKVPTAGSRILPMLCGAPSGQNDCSLVIFSIAAGDQGGVMGIVIRDMAIAGSPGVMDCGALDSKLKNLRICSQPSISGGMQGIISGPGQAAYNIDIDDCYLEGWDVGIALAWTSARIRNTDIGRGGVGFARFAGCDGQWYGGQHRQVSNLKFGMDFPSGDYGGVYKFIANDLDNESSPFSDSVFRVDGNQNSIVIMGLDRCFSSSLGVSPATFVRLRRGAGTVGGVFDMEGCYFGAGNATPGPLMTVEADHWRGVLNLKTPTPNKTVTGAGDLTGFTVIT